MQQKKPKIVETALSEKPKGQATKIEAISASGNLKVAVKSQTTGGAGNVQSVAVERTKTPTKTPDVKAVTPLAGSQAAKDAKPAKAEGAENNALPFPKKAKIQQSPAAAAPQADKAPAASAPPKNSATNPKQPLMLVAAGAALVLVLGVVALQFGGASEEAESTAEAPAPVSSPVDITKVTPKPAPVEAAPVTAAPVPAAEEMTDGEKMIAKMTAGTLAALRGQGNAQTAPEPTPAQAAADAAAVSVLYNMVVTAVSQGQSEAYIDQLVNEAYANGEIAVPAGLIGANGRVDTQSILSLFIAQ